MQLIFQLLIEIVKDYSLFPQAIDHELEILVDSNCFIELLVGLIESVLKDLDLLLKIIQVLSSRIDSMTVLFLLNNFFLKVCNMNFNILLRLFFLLNGIGNFVEKFFHTFSIHAVPWLIILLIINFSLNRIICTISSFRDSFSFLSLSIDIFCFFMKLIVSSANNFLSFSRFLNFFCCSNNFYCFFFKSSWSMSSSPNIFYFF